MGFLSTVPQCSTGVCGTREDNGNRFRTRVIPEMSFTCHGTVTHWRAAGEFRTQGNAMINSVLSIWRERSSERGTYNRVGEVELGTCGNQVPAPSVTNVYECTLPQSERVSVQPGDIVGIELPPENDANFQLYFDSTNSGPANSVFDSHDSTFSLSQASSNITQDQPQVSLTVEPDTATTIPILPTILPLTVTEAPSTTTDLPIIPPPTTTKVTSMATTEPLTEAANTMSSRTAMEDSATTSTITMAPPSRDEAVQPESDTSIGTIAGAAVGSIIAILLVLIIVLLLVLVLRRQSQSGQKFTPSNNSTIVNPVYNGKPIVPNLEGIFH